MLDKAGGRRIEKSLASQARDYAIDHRAVWPEHGAEVLELDGGGVAVWGSSRGAVNVSRAFALGIDVEVKPETFSRVEAFYARHGERTRIVTSPWTHASVFELLASRRYRAMDVDNVLTRRIAVGDACPKPAAGVSVTRVEARRDAVLEWGRVVRVGFDMDADDERYVAADRVFDRSKTATLFLARVDGEPAGGSALDVRDGIATLFATSTLPAFRRRGVHGALVAARLSSALERGAELAVVLTSPGNDSQRNLEMNHGFRVAYAVAVFESLGEDHGARAPA